MTNAYRIGDRVELHPATDDWMRGDRFGMVVGMGGDPLRVMVRLDRSDRVRRYRPVDIFLVERLVS
jgi:hypothetical protein